MIPRFISLLTFGPYCSYGLIGQYFSLLFLDGRHSANVARPRQFDEEKILAAVRDLFWCQDMRATSLDDLMRVTGLGKGSIYGAFGDKRNLFLAVLRVYADERVVSRPRTAQ